MTKSAVLALLFATAAAAQQAAPEPTTPPAEAPAATQPSTPTEAPPPATTAIPARSATEEIVVTGSRIRRKDLTTPAPVTVVTREQFETSGKATIGDYLQTMPEQGNAPNFQLNTGGINYGADGATRINLRSLGLQRTLVLINGRRVVPAGLGASSSVDLNTIPTEAVDRVEVLKDGASAVYGSDAVAGVVNIITRRNFSGTQLGAQYGISQRGDAQTFDAHVTTGFADPDKSATFSVRYFNQKESWLRDRDWGMQALDYDYTGGGAGFSGSSRVPQGALRIPEDPNKPGSPDCRGNAFCIQLTSTLGWSASQRYIRNSSSSAGGTAVVCGTDPAGNTDCFRKFNSVAPDNGGSGNDFYNYGAENYLSIPSTSLQAFSAGDVKWAAVRGYYEASYVQRNTVQNAAFMPLSPGDYNNNVYSADSVYNPFGTDISFLGRRLVEFPHRTYAEELGTFRVVTGLDGTIPEQLGPLAGWYWDANMNYGKTSGTFTTGGSFRNSRIATAAGPSAIVNGQAVCLANPADPTSVIDGCTPLNLLGGPGSIGAAQQDYLGFSGTSRAFDALFSVGLNVEGNLFSLAADRPVSLALGYEFRRQSGAQVADPVVQAGDSADFNFKSTNGFFTVNEAYAELSVPLLANIQGVEALELDAAARFVDYSTFGSNVSFKVGARYTPVHDVTVRGTFSTAFRAPTISELYLGGTETDPAATDPCADLSIVSATVAARCKANGVTGSGSGDTGLQELTREGGTPTLKAETANIITVGVVVQPRMVKGLSLTVDYYNISIDNAIGFTGTPYILYGCYYGGNSEFCNDIVRNKSGSIQYVNDFYNNLGNKKAAGIDFAIRYAMPTGIGRFGIGFDGNFLTQFDSTVAGLPTVHGLGNYDLGANPVFKALASLDYNLGGFNAGIIGHYVASFTECSNPYEADTAQGGFCNLTDGTMNPLSRSVHPYVQFDLHAGYMLKSNFGKTGIYAGISNLFDRSPPYVFSAALANSDPATYDYLGRYVYGRIQHTF